MVVYRRSQTHDAGAGRTESVGAAVNWQDEQFVKVYTRDTGEWTLLSWDAQALLLQILRKVDRSGVLQLGKHGARVLPAALGHRDQAERITAALQELTADGCVVLRPECLVVPNFIAAQTSRQSDKARQQSARDRRRAESMGSSLPAEPKTSQNVTDCHLASPGVTGSHLASPRVTLDKSRSDETREEKDSGVTSEPKQPELELVPQQAADANQKPKESGTSAGAEPEHLGMPLGDEGVVEQPKDEEPDPVTVERHLAIHVFGYLLAARKRCKPSARTVEPTETHLKEITRCLREGIEAQDLIHVVDVWEAQVKSGRQDMAHFDSVTPFRAANVAKYLQMSLDDARKPRGQAPQAMRPPEPPKSPRPAQSDFERRRKELESSE